MIKTLDVKIYVGVILHTLGGMLTTSIENSVFLYLTYLGLLLFIWGLFKSDFCSPVAKKYIPSSYWFMMFIVLTMFLRYDSEGANAGQIQTHTGTIVSSFLFLVLLINPFSFRLNDIIKYCLILTGIAFVYSIIYWKDIVLAHAWLNNEGSIRLATMGQLSAFGMLSCSFLLCIQHILPKKIVYLSMAGLLFGLILMMVAGRRSYTFINFLFISIAFYLYIKNNPTQKKFWRYVIVGALLAGMVLFFLSKQDTMFVFLLGRIEANTREGIEFYWAKDMAKDPFAWIWGKGASGGYYDGDFGFVRGGIELGFQHIVLKGGLLMFIPYLWLHLYAAYLAYFKSRSKVMKGLSMYILVWTLNIYFKGVPSFLLVHLLVWISFGWIFNPRIRSMNDSQFKKLFLK